MKIILSSIFYTLISFLLIVNASASETLSYSGRLVNPNGSPVVGPVNLKVELAYSNSPTVIRCSQIFSNIILSNGVFHLNVNFDCGSPVTLSQVLTQIPANESAAIRVTNITDPANPKVYSFQALHSMPFANIAETSKQLVQMEATNGQVLKWDNATARWKPGAAGGGGTVTSVSGTLPISVATGSSTAVISMPVANTSTSGYLSFADWNTFNTKEGTIAGGTALQYYRGDKSWQTLNTSVVPESGVTNLYFSNARVLGVPLDGFVAGPGVIVATDTVLQAFAKTQGQINSLNTDAAKYLIKNNTDSITGVVSVGTTGLLQLVYTPMGLNDATNKAYVDSRDDTKLNLSGGTLTGDVSFETQIKLKDGATTNYVTLKAPASGTTSHTLTLPGVVGTNGQVLTMTGTAGVLAWGSPATTAAPTGAAGGDLSGTYPNPSITALDATKISGGTVDNTEFNTLNGVTSSIQTQLDAKEAAVSAGTTVQYYRGDKSWQALDTLAVPENSRLYFTNARVLGTDLLGLNTGVAGPIIAADTVLGAFGKLQYQVTDLKAKGQWEKNVNDIYYNAGNVGIGTSVPDTLFHVNSDTTQAVIKVKGPGSTSNYSTLNLESEEGGTDKRWELSHRKTPANTLQFSYYNGASWIDPLAISSAGNVGIGITAPITKLDIRSFYSFGSSQNGALRLERYNDNTAAGWIDNIVGLGVFDNSQYDGSGFRKANSTTSSGTQYSAGNILFYTNSGLTVGALYTPGERMRIDTSGNVGIGTIAPATKLDVAGAVRVGTDATTCAAGISGAIRYNAGSVEFCNGTAWTALVSGSTALSSLNGLTAGTQTFAIGTSGTAPAFNSATSTHTLNIPLASTASVTAGLLSKTQYDAFNAKLGTATAFSGDVSGAYNATSVDKIKGSPLLLTAPASGNFLKFNGTNWINSILAATDIPNLDAAKITTGVLPVARGGTGSGTLTGNRMMVSNAGGTAIVEAAVLTNGQLLIGSTGAAPVAATLTAGSGVTITNNVGGISIAATGSGGTVTSVSGTAPVSVATGTTTPVISMAAATGSVNGYLTSGDWTTFSSKLGTATAFSGDVSGTYNATSVDKIKGSPLLLTAPASGNFLKFNGTNWINSILAATDIPNLDAAKITTGVLPVARGGTGVSTLTANKVYTANATGTGFQSFGCATTELLSFNGLGEPVCIANLGTTAFVQNGNSFGGSAVLGTNDNFPLNFETNSTTKMTILADGKVGIGTTVPGRDLDIAKATVMGGVGARIYNTTTGGLSEASVQVKTGSVNAFTEIRNVDGATPYTIFESGAGNTGGVYLDIKANAPLMIRTNSAQERMRINGDGNVGIGTATPGTNTKLSVEGQIRSKSFTTTSGAIDWQNGNSGTTSFNCGTNITFANLRDGGSYTLVVTDTGTTTCNFSTTTTGDDAATVSYRFLPANANRTASTHSLYSLQRIGTTVYVSWMTGF